MNSVSDLCLEDFDYYFKDESISQLSLSNCLMDFVDVDNELFNWI